MADVGLFSSFKGNFKKGIPMSLFLSPTRASAVPQRPMPGWVLGQDQHHPHLVTQAELFYIVEAVQYKPADLRNGKHNYENSTFIDVRDEVHVAYFFVHSGIGLPQSWLGCTLSDCLHYNVVQDTQSLFDTLDTLLPRE